VRHEVTLDQRDENGTPYRDHLELKAKRGDAKAIRELEPPCDPPDVLLYLMDWAYELVGRSGATMAGLAPLSYPTVESWARLMDLTLSPLEVRALIALDAVLRHPDTDEPDEEPETNHAWPERQDG